MADDASPHILLVDDDLRLRGLLETYLKREGFAVSSAGNAEQMERALRDCPVDLMVLDLMLPGRGGLDICRELRASQNSLPVIMLTAKGDDIDRILGLELGADDYLPKPCNPRELVARIRAVLRRREGPDPFEADELIALGNIRMDIDARRLYVNDQEMKLRKKEFTLLRLLLENPGRVLTREVLIDRVWGSDYVGDTKTLDVHIKRLRTLIEDDPKNPTHITTVRGVGYRYEVAKS
jgi:DNA-binding response OmpR family regulator